MTRDIVLGGDRNSGDHGKSVAQGRRWLGRRPAYASLIVLACALSAAWPGQNAQARQLVDNPLVQLKAIAGCPDTTSTSPRKTPSDQPKEEVEVTRSTIMTAMLKRYPVSIPFSELEGDGKIGLAEVVANAVTGCERTLVGKTTRHCDLDAYPDISEVLTDSLRVTDANGLRMRRALLRLFRSADTEFREGLPIVLRKEGWTQSGVDLQVYRPFVNARDDDVVLRAFIAPETVGNSSPYRVVCPTVAVLGKAEQERQGRVPYPSESTGAWLAALNGAWDGHTSERVERQDGQSTRWARKPALVKTETDFSKPSPDAASLGFTEGGKDGDNIKIDAAVGYSFRKLWDDGKSIGTGQKRFTDPRYALNLTPYFSVSQNAVKNTFATGVDENGDQQTSTENLAYARYAFGGRVVWEDFGPVYERIERLEDRNRAYGATFVGLRKPKWKFGLTGEVLADNRGDRHGNRLSMDVTPPRHWDLGLGRGYRMREELIDLDQFGNVSNPLWSNLSFLWDVRGVGEHIDYTADGAPRNFKSVDPDARIDIDRFDTVLIGYDFEADLRLANLFGAIGSDSWLSLKAAHIYRWGYDPTSDFANPLVGGIDMCGETDPDCDDRDASKFTLTLGLAHPDYSKLSVNVVLASGQDVTDLTSAESIALTIGAKY